MDTREEDLSGTLKEFDAKITTFSSILEKFGLDIITKMGQTNLKIKQLTDMVGELSKTTIDIKGLIPQLSNVIQNQKRLEDELSLVKSLLLNLSSTPSIKPGVENTVERDESATDTKNLIVSQFNELETKLENTDDPQYVKAILEQLRIEIFEFTGGHSMLNQFAQIITRLNSAISMNDLMNKQDSTSKTIKVEIMESIPNWRNKLMIKN
ncbi:unnamed protein product [marine sediment metagenome]|uniref:Uncharacterized protein n=1 Tax=marine sediment metagenome TaxID=412755 RepID=X1B4F2_9ZZZZ